jgi:integrase
VNNHLASLSAFTTRVHAQAPGLFPAGDPAKGIREVRLPPLEPRALSEAQVRSLKNVCDRLERFHELRGREWKRRDRDTPGHARGRPARDRAIVFVLLSTGLKREELVLLDLSQVSQPRGRRFSARPRLTGRRAGRPAG